MTQTDNSIQQTTQASSRYRLRRAIALAVAALVALIVWVLAVPVFGIALVVDSGASAQTVPAVSVIAVSVIAGVAAWALLALFERLFRRGRRAWLVVAWAVLAVSMLGPLSMGGSGGVLVALLIMHVGVGLTLIFGLSGYGRRRARVN